MRSVSPWTVTYAFSKSQLHTAKNIRKEGKFFPSMSHHKNSIKNDGGQMHEKNTK